MKRFASFAGALAMVAGTSSFAHAASVGLLTCTAENRQISVNLSYFDFGATKQAGVAGTTGTTTTSAAAATVTTQALNVHAALSQFGPLFESVNRKISTCSLSARLPDGTVADFTFSGVNLTSVTAVARTGKTASDGTAELTRAIFTFDKIKVISSGGSDDGGTDGGWYTPTGTGPTSGNSI